MNEINPLMWAAEFVGPKEMHLKQIKTPSPDGGEILVSVERCGICPSDVRAYEGKFRSPPEYPMITGHEWAGVVVSLGINVVDIEVGDRVVVDYHGPCDVCYFCRRGYPNYCENLFRRQGGFAQYSLARTRGVYKLPKNVSFDEAAFCEPLACCLSGIETLDIKPGDDVTVIGCGPIGLLHIQLASKAYGARVIAIDLLPERLEAALRLGATNVILASEKAIVKEVKCLTKGRGTNGVVIAVGDPSLIQSAVEMTAPLGVVNAFAGFHPSGIAELDFNLIHYLQIKVTGSFNFLPKHFAGALRAIEIGLVNVKEIISDVLPLKDIEKGLEKVSSQNGLKVLIAPNV